MAYQTLTGYHWAGTRVGGGTPGVVTTGVGGARVFLAGREKREEQKDKQHFLKMENISNKLMFRENLKLYIKI